MWFPKFGDGCQSRINNGIIQKRMESKTILAPKVSVIVPVYGVEKYIERCVRSLFGQTLDDIEYLFVNDCTPDRSMEILSSVLEEYSQRKDQVVIHRMEHNSGQAAVRQWGMLHSTGEYVIFCDSDDWVNCNMYKLMYDKAIEEEADVVVCDFNITNGEKVLRTVKGCSSTNKELFIKQILLQCDPWSLCNKLFRRTICYNADLVYPKGNMGEDFVITTQLLLNSEKIVHIAQPLYNYFINTYSITRVEAEEKKMENFRMNKENADIVYDILNDYGFDVRFSQALVSNKWYIKKLLWNTSFSTEKRKLWKETYGEINNKIISNSHISVKDKVKFILTYMHLFPRQSKNR